MVTCMTSYFYDLVRHTKHKTDVNTFTFYKDVKLVCSSIPSWGRQNVHLVVQIIFVRFFALCFSERHFTIPLLLECRTCNGNKRLFRNHFHFLYVIKNYNSIFLKHSLQLRCNLSHYLKRKKFYNCSCCTTFYS